MLGRPRYRHTASVSGAIGGNRAAHANRFAILSLRMTAKSGIVPRLMPPTGFAFEIVPNILP
jgi:hypothetical protein